MSLRASRPLVAGTFVAQGLAAASIPLLSRFSTPDAVGTWSALAALAGVVGVNAALRLDQGIHLPVTDDDARDLFWVSLLLSAFIGIMTVGLVSFTFAVGVGGDSIVIAGYMGLAVFFSGSYVSASAWSLRKQRVGAVGRSRVGQSGGFLFVAVVGGVFARGSLGVLLVADLVNRGFGIPGLARRSGTDPRSRRERPVPSRASHVRSSIGNGWAQAIRYSQLARWGVGANVLSMVSPAMLLVVGPIAYGSVAAGHLAIAVRGALLPAAVVSQALSAVVLADSAMLIRGNRFRELSALIKDTASVLIRVGFLLFLAIALASPALAGPILGEDWVEVGRYLALLSLSSYSTFVVGALASIYTSLERQRLVFSVVIVDVVVRASVLGASWYASWGVRSTLILLSVTSALVAYVNFVIIAALAANAPVPSEGQRARRAVQASENSIGFLIRLSLLGVVMLFSARLPFHIAVGSGLLVGLMAFYMMYSASSRLRGSDL